VRSSESRFVKLRQSIQELEDEEIRRANVLISAIRHTPHGEETCTTVWSTHTSSLLSRCEFLVCH
jgi:hypothetical protein